MNLSDKGQLIQYLKENNLWTKKSMGQNFLVDESVLGKIIAAADLKTSDTVVEIGPGLGVLTAELIKHAGKVIAIEKDDKLASKLNDKFLISNFKINSKSQNPNVKILNQDALEVNINEILKQVQDDNKVYKVVANIPYNITSLIIRKFLEVEAKPSEMILMVQKEVAERIIASAGEMSLLSVSVQFYAEPEIIDIVPAEAFFPVPKVDSTIIKLITNSEKRIVNEKDFFRIVKFGFSSKRKTLENNLAGGLHISKTEASDIIREAGLSEKIRAQELSIENWLELLKVVNSKIKN